MAYLTLELGPSNGAFQLPKPLVQLLTYLAAKRYSCGLVIRHLKTNSWP